MNAGRELDALVAEKVMGWRYVESCDKDRMIHFMHPQIIASDSMKGAVRETWRRSRRAASNAPNFSTDMTNSWEVVEKMESDGFLFSIGRDSGPDGPSDWVGCFRRWGSVAATGYIATADAAEATICLAALKAVGVEIT